MDPSGQVDHYSLSADQALDQLLAAQQAQVEATRVMSPTPTLTMALEPQQQYEQQLALSQQTHSSGRSALGCNTIVGMEVEMWGLRSGNMPCERCNSPCIDVFVCNACYRSGHAQCLNIQAIDGFGFCSDCLPWALQQKSRHVTAQEQAKWTGRLSAQLAAWRESTVTATGVLGAIGLAVGGAGAMAASGTHAFLTGMVQGARSGASTPRATAQLEDAASISVPDEDTQVETAGEPSVVAPPLGEAIASGTAGDHGGRSALGRHAITVGETNTPTPLSGRSAPGRHVIAGVGSSSEVGQQPRALSAPRATV